MQRNRSISAAVLAVGVAGLLAHAARYLPYITDDALISLRYAERLLDGKGLTWTDGEAVEGYSNLLWVLAVASLGALGVDLVDAVRVLGVAGFAAAMAALVWRHRPSTLASSLPALAGSLAIAASGSVAVWAVGGLEPPLLAGLLAWALVLAEPLLADGRASFRSVWVPGTLFGLLCITRPDGALFTAAACVTLILVVRARTSLRTAMLLASIPAAFVAAQIAFRLVTYGDWLPNTARPRLVLSAEHLSQGAAYTWDGLLALGGLVLPALLAVGLAIAHPSRRRWVSFLAVPLVLWTAYTTALGGDYLPGRRHFVPIVVLSAFLASETWAWWVGRPRRAVRLAAWLAAGASLSAQLWMQLRHDTEVHRALTEQWEWDGKAVGQLLSAAFGDEGPLVAVDAAGCLPYFSKLPALDMLGLNDRHIASHPPDNLGDGPVGHELGDGRYVLEREPDLVIFCTPKGRTTPCFPSGRQMVQQPAFAEEYRLVSFVAEGPPMLRSLVYVRIDSPRIGISREPDRIVVPAYLFAADPSLVARLGEHGRLHVVVGSRASRLQGVRLPPGVWQAKAQSASPITVDLVASQTGLPLAAGGEAGSVVVGGPGGEDVDIVLTTTRATRVYSVELSRQP